MPLSKLQEIRAAGVSGRTVGLSDGIIERFAATNAALRLVVREAAELFGELRASHPELLALDEP